MKAAGDYAKQIHISASPERVFDALTTAAAGFAAWWAPAAGSAAAIPSAHPGRPGYAPPGRASARVPRNSGSRHHAHAPAASWGTAALDIWSHGV
jgi:hypothetical protein